MTTGTGLFNGDDAVALLKGGVIIDVIGQIGLDPGTEWGTGLTSTADNTLRRKSTITSGDTNGSNAFDPSLEWDGFAEDTFNGLGSHTIIPGPLTTPVTLTVTDANNNQSTCVALVTVLDVTAPVVTTAPNALDVTLQCSNAAGLTTALALAPQGTDACGAPTVVLTGDNVSNQNGNAYVRTRTWVLKDASNNQSLPFTQVITVIDTQGPTWVNEPTSVNIECLAGQPNDTTFYSWIGSFTGTDSCGTVFVTNNYDGPVITCANPGSATVTFTLTDANNNSIQKTASFTLYIQSPTFASITQTTAECDNPNSQFALTGLLANATITLVYTINGGAEQSINGVTASATGTATVTIPLPSDGDGQTLTVVRLVRTDVPGVQFEPASGNTVVIEVNNSTIWYADADSDGYGNPNVTIQDCDQPQGYIAVAGDCNDNNAAINPAATEICDGIDNDCNGSADDGLVFITYYVDADQDGYGVDGTGVSLCANPGVGFATVAGDCNDTNAAVNPGAAEIRFDNIDNDCDGLLNNGFPPVVSVIQQNKCGTVNNGLNNTLNTTEIIIPGYFVTYLFKVTNTSTGEVDIVPRAVPNFKLTMTDIYQYDTWYTIEVAVVVNGEEQPYGPPCSIKTTTVQTSKVVNAQCGATLNAINATVNTTNVGSANLYRFRVSKADTPTNYFYITNTLPKFELTGIAGLPLSFNTEYLVSVQVRVKLAGIEAWSQYGDLCSVLTPVAPENSIVTSQCFSTATSNTQQIYATAYPSATQYIFRLQLFSEEEEDENGFPLVTYSQSVTRNVPYFTLSLIPGLQPDTTYSVSVAMVVFGIQTDFGKDCFITTPGGARQINPANSSLAAPFQATGMPNPYTTDFSIRVNSAHQVPVTIAIYDSVGRLLETATLASEQLSAKTFGVNYPSGVYHVVVSQGDDLQTIRMLKK